MTRYPLSRHPQPLVESRQKEIDGLLEKGVFELVPISPMPEGIGIVNSRVVDKIKSTGTATAFEKSRLVVQAHNHDDNEMVLTQASTIRRMCQRLIFALSAINPQFGLCLGDISRAYVQSTTSLNRQFYIRPPVKPGLQNDSGLKVIKPLYGVPERCPLV